MKLLALRIVLFLAVLAGLAWLVQPNDQCQLQISPEKVATFLGALASFIGSEAIALRSSLRHHPNDRLLLSALHMALPPEAVAFLREHDFDNSFLRRQTDYVVRFSEAWIGADKAFIDADVEKKKAQLVSAAKALAALIASKTSPVGVDYQSVFAESLRGEPRPDWVIVDAKKINVAATEFVSSYDDFVRVAHRKIPLAE